jgi:hypothetical protein
MEKPDEREAMARLREQMQSEHEFDVRMLTNRSVILGAGKPGMIGARLLENGIRYGAVLGLPAAQPFFSGAVLACGRAATIEPKKGRDSTVYDVLYDRFLAHYGLFVSEPLSEGRETPASSTHLAMALASLTMAFTERIGRGAKKDPASFRTPEFSSYALAVLSLARLARLWEITVADDVVEQIGQIQVHKRHDRLRRALHAVLNEESEENESKLREVFRATVHVGAYHGVFVADLQFTHAYACSLAAFRGQMITALAHLLHD